MRRVRYVSHVYPRTIGVRHVSDVDTTTNLKCLWFIGLWFDSYPHAINSCVKKAHIGLCPGVKWAPHLWMVGLDPWISWSCGPDTELPKSKKNGLLIEKNQETSRG